MTNFRNMVHPILVAIVFVLSFPTKVLKTANAFPVCVVSQRAVLSPPSRVSRWISLRERGNSNEHCRTVLHQSMRRKVLNSGENSVGRKKKKIADMMAFILSKGKSLCTSINSSVRGRLEHNQKSHLPPVVQLCIVLVCYIIHLNIFTQNSLVFPIQIIPNDRGWFQSIGYDSLAGIFSLVVYCYLSFVSQQQFSSNTVLTDGKKQSASINQSCITTPTFPKLFEDPNYESLPWKVSRYRLKARFTQSDNNTTIPTRSNVSSSSRHEDVDGVKKNESPTILNWAMAGQAELERVSLSTRRTALFLLVAYRWTGQFAQVCENSLYRLAGLGVPMTIAMHRSLAVLLSHLSWVFMGTFILSIDLFPDFFGLGFGKHSKRKWMWWKERRDNASLDSQNRTGMNSMWYTNKWNASWVWWVIGGYFVSSWLFNIADMINQIVLPSSVFEHAGEGVVAQLISPENNAIWASIVGYIAPCLSAPVWEELLYRGFMLPAMCLFMPFWVAIVVSGFVFSAHHMSATGFIPLMVLGMAWATLYAKCQNLLVTILIHAMWNSRVFIGSWLGF